ncbi:C4-type zinc ribbon domain-containing protein [Bernardetia sp. ABR2-2B]|uniref:zinc ribbon domain-containing protein n=1 Tax=Bernardetia sp. ABR2-2B TaxID=3127472 RepID=UPI0030D50FB8
MEQPTPVAKRIDALVKLQEVDSKLDELRKIKGDLPEEVQDLEDEIEGYQTRITKFEAEKKSLTDLEATQDNSIKDHKKLIVKYEEQQMDVRNDREFQAIAREIENQQLDIRLAEKAVRDTQYKVERKQKQIEETRATLEERKKDLENKKNELEGIVKESEEEEAKLMKEREKRKKNVADNLYLSYERIRENARNGLAVVNVKRNACGGCFNIVPPQRQVDIKERKKLVVCEHCGRVFADVEAVEVVEKKRTTRRKRVTKKDKEAAEKAKAEKAAKKAK